MPLSVMGLPDNTTENQIGHIAISKRFRRRSMERNRKKNIGKRKCK
jgi:hypothetical protein